MRGARDHTVLAWWTFMCFMGGLVGSFIGGVLSRVI